MSNLLQVLFLRKQVIFIRTTCTPTHYVPNDIVDIYEHPCYILLTIAIEWITYSGGNRMNERESSFFMAIRLNWVEWSYISPPDARFLTCQIKEKLSVGEMRQIFGLKVTLCWNSTPFQRALFIIIELYTYDLSDWLNVECLCGGTWFTELKDYFYSTCTLFTFTSKRK